MRPEWLLAVGTANVFEGLHPSGLALIKSATDVSCSLEVPSSIQIIAAAALLDGAGAEIWLQAARNV